MTMKYPVNDIYTCIQGEGCQTGLAMIMLRLHGCEVGCPWCDTKETWSRDPLNQYESIGDVLGATSRWASIEADEIALYLAELTRLGGPKWVLISGGEPADNDLRPLVVTLHEHGFKCAVETSGTALGHVGAGIDWITVSPKLNMPGGLAVLAKATREANEIKFPVGKPSDIDTLLGLIDRGFVSDNTAICLQPLSLSPGATKLCEETARQKGWRLSVQVHKLLQLR